MNAQIGAILLERAHFVDTSQRVVPYCRNDPIHPEMAARIAAAICHGEPLTLILPAFPAKSANPQKTISHLPDLGEVLALGYLNGLCQRLNALHPPGVRLVICSDGRVFNDLVGVTDQSVDAYREALRGIVGRERYLHLSTYDLDNYYGGKDFTAMRRALLADFGDPLEMLRRQITHCDDHRAKFSGIHRFIFEDMLVACPSATRNQVRTAAKQVAYQVVQRSDAWSRLLASRFPHALRLSIHPHTRAIPKLGVKLVPGAGPWATPWHSCAVKDGEAYFLAKRLDAVKRGATLRVYEGKYAYFEL